MNASVPEVPTTTTAPSEVFRMFHNSGRPPILIGLYGIKVLIAIVAIFLNGNLAWVTFKSKSLRSNCNLLLALYASCSCFQQANFFVPFASVLAGHIYIPYGHCFLFQAVPIFCAFAAFPLTLFIAFERFLGVFCPIWYKKRNRHRFLVVTLMVCAALGLYVFAQDVRTALEDPNQEVICAVGPKVDASFFTFLILAMNLTSVCLYVAIWARIRFSAGQFSTIQKQVIRCLFVILLLELFGWALSVFLRLTLAPLLRIPPSSFLGYLIINLTTNLAYIAMAMTTPVLYWFSKEHREALQRHFARFVGTNTVHADTMAAGRRVEPQGLRIGANANSMVDNNNNTNMYITNIVSNSRSSST